MIMVDVHKYVIILMAPFNAHVNMAMNGIMIVIHVLVCS